MGKSFKTVLNSISYKKLFSALRKFLRLIRALKLGNSSSSLNVVSLITFRVHLDMFACILLPLTFVYLKIWNEAWKRIFEFLLVCSRENFYDWRKWKNLNKWNGKTLHSDFDNEERKKRKKCVLEICVCAEVFWVSSR